MASVNINGTLFTYVEQGSGPPVVFVHGSASDYRTWHGQLDGFGKHFRAIAYSRRYHWPNAPIPDDRDYSMTEHVEDLEAFLRLLGATPAHLVGQSYGAYVTLLLAIKSPQYVRTLVLAEPPAITLFVSNTPKPREILKLLVQRPRTAVAIVKLGATGLGPATAAVKRGDMEAAMRLFGTAALGRAAYHRLSEQRKEQVRANLIKAEFLGTGFLPLPTHQLRSVRIPALLVAGQASPKVFHRLLDRIEELLPNTERVEIHGASHIMHEDNPSTYNEAVIAFLLKHEKAAQQDAPPDA